MADNWYKSVPTLLSWPASVGYFLIPTFQTQLSVVKLNLLTTQFSPLKIQIEIMGEISCISAEISAPQFPPNPQLIRELHGIVLDSQLIDLLGLYILFSQYRSCDNTQEAWSFVLFIKKSAYALILMNKTKDQTS